MVFCGQCGSQLAPGSTTCPRCGSVTEPELAVEDPHTNDPTVASVRSAAPPTLQPGTQRPGGTQTPPHQEKLVLRPNVREPSFGKPASNEPTSMIPAQAQGSGNFAGKRNPSPFPPGDMGYSPAPGQFGSIQPPQRPRRRGRGRVLALLVILLLLVMGATAVFVAKPDLLNGLLGNNATLTPSKQAQAVIQQYYQDINNRDYQDGYNLWGSDYQSKNSFSDFSMGYAHTRHDDITINKLTPLSNGTVKAEITIVALEDTTSGTPVTHTYRGTYIIGQENGAWKFLSGSFNRVG